MKFDFDKYKGHYVMHCKTVEEANDFCRVMHENGRRWNSDESYVGHTNWYDYKEDTVYYFNAGTYGTIKHVNRISYRYLDPFTDFTILEWSDFMKNKKFTKADLQLWDIVLRGNGEVAIIAPWFDLRGMVFRNGAILRFDLIYNDDLTNKSTDHTNIVAVRRVDNVSDLSFDVFEKGIGTLVYDRERDDPDIVEMTMEDVCKALGKRVKIVDGK